MKRLYLIRHSAPAFPAGEKLCIAATELPLSREGHTQAAAVAKALPPVAAVYSSPRLRCRETAAYLSAHVAVLEGLEELGVGQWEGLSFSQIRREFPAYYAARGMDPTLPPPGGEPPEAALARFRRALETAAEETPGDCAIVTHGGILGAYLKAATGLWRKPGYGEVLTLTWDGEELVLEL